MIEIQDVLAAEYSYAEHEHRELARGIDEIHRVASAVGSGTGTNLQAAIMGVRSWLRTVLEPHAAWEDKVVYEEMDQRAGTPWATRAMRFEHYQIERAGRALDHDVDRLNSPLTHDDLSEVRGHLFALEALLRAHIEREEALLLPLLAPNGRPAPST